MEHWGTYHKSKQNNVSGIPVPLLWVWYEIKNSIAWYSLCESHHYCMIQRNTINCFRPPLVLTVYRYHLQQSERWLQTHRSRRSTHLLEARVNSPFTIHSMFVCWVLQVVAIPPHSQATYSNALLSLLVERYVKAKSSLLQFQPTIFRPVLSRHQNQVILFLVTAAPYILKDCSHTLSSIFYFQSITSQKIWSLSFWSTSHKDLA